MEKIQKNDFVEIEFTGLANNEVFDTTNKEDAKKMGIEADVKPIIISVGNEMLLKGFDKEIEGKELEKNYSVKLSPKDAFGFRNPQLIKTVPIKVFKEKDIMPYPGLSLQMDNYVVKIISVSGGRVIVDFNNPLAGKEVEYDFKVKRIVTDEKEKINALQEFFFRDKYDFEIKDKKVIFKNKPSKDPLGDKKLNFLIEIFGKKFNEITGYDFEIESKDDLRKKEENNLIEAKEPAKEDSLKENKRIKKEKQKILI